MQYTFEKLYGEPDVPAKIFAELNPKDVGMQRLEKHHFWMFGLEKNITKKV